MKKFITAILFAILAIVPFAGACDPSFPSGIHGALTVTIPNCTADNYQATDIAAYCTFARESVLEVLNADAPSGTSFRYVDAKDDANLIIYVHLNVQTDGNIVATLVTYGMGLTADNHTLFSAVGDPSMAGQSYVSALHLFGRFLNEGWNCN